jgi:hypothetical protein
VPNRELILVVADGVCRWPPDLVVGGGDHGAEVGAGSGAAEGDVGVRCEPFLWFDGGELLHVVAEVAAQVLDQPVGQGLPRRASRGP